MVLTSLPFVRRRAFNTFLYSHSAFVVFFLFVYLHTSSFSNYLLAAGIIYASDKLLRAVWGMLPRSTINIDTSHEGIMSLTFPKNAAARALSNYRPGQYVRVKKDNAKYFVGLFLSFGFSCVRAHLTFVCFLFFFVFFFPPCTPCAGVRQRPTRVSV